MTGLIEIKSSLPAKLENLEKTFKMQGPQTEKNSCFDLQLHLKQQIPYGFTSFISQFTTWTM